MQSGDYIAINIIELKAKMYEFLAEKVKNKDDVTKTEEAFDFVLRFIEGEGNVG